MPRINGQTRIVQLSWDTLKRIISDAKVAPIHLREPDLALCRANLGISALVPCLTYKLDKLCKA